MSEPAKNIFLIEDDLSLKSAIEAFLKKSGYHVSSFDRVEETLGLLEGPNTTSPYPSRPPCDLILSDVMMPGLSGYDLLHHLQKMGSTVPLILMTAYGSIEKAVYAMKQGAYDFLVKPFSLQVLETTVNAAFADSQAWAEPKQAGSNHRIVPELITENPAMKTIITNLKKVALSKATVLIQGESGTGKELLARLLHTFSPRVHQSFVAINCAALPDNLLESELFGHERGSFTGAVTQHQGKFEASNNGTILLDEISEMSLSMQTKLLRVLQECEIYRVGGTRPISINLRVVATTNRDLYEYTSKGFFREDLFYRINVIPITVPPLRDRGGDASLLAEAFLDEFSKIHKRPRLKLDAVTRKKINDASWFGNVRELRNAMERAILMGRYDETGQESATAKLRSSFSKHSDRQEESWLTNDSFTLESESQGTLDQIIKTKILDTLHFFEGNRTKTAKKLGISLRTLRNKLKTFKEKRETKK